MNDMDPNPFFSRRIPDPGPDRHQNEMDLMHWIFPSFFGGENIKFFSKKMFCIVSCDEYKLADKSFSSLSFYFPSLLHFFFPFCLFFFIFPLNPLIKLIFPPCFYDFLFFHTLLVDLFLILLFFL